MALTEGALTTVEEVKARLEDVSGTDLDSLIAATIEEASDQARFYGLEWTSATVPPSIARIVASACARFVRNPDAYSQSRAADETLVWQEQEHVGEVYFSEAQIERIRKIAFPPVASFGSFVVARGGLQRPQPDVYLPVEGFGSPFPMFRECDVP